jgi:predicted nucleotidyltransferase
MHSDLVKAADLIGVELPALEEASVTSERLLSGYNEALEKEFSKNEPDDLEMTDIVLCGSIAREECSFQSDCDYYVLQNGASPNTTRKLIEAMSRVEKDFPIGEKRRPKCFQRNCRGSEPI